MSETTEQNETTRQQVPHERVVMCDLNEAEVRALCEKIARDVMALGDEPDSPAQRMQYMGGTWPDNEREQGGVCEKALATFLTKSLVKHLST